MPLFDEIGDWIWVVPCVLLGLALLPYVLGPVLVYFTLKLSGDPQLEEFYLHQRSLPRAVRRYVNETVADVEEDGFAVMGAYFLAGFVTNVRSFVVLVGKEKTCDLAILAVTYAESPVEKMQQKHVEFLTPFGDD